jgi:hypothetical protein
VDWRIQEADGAMMLTATISASAKDGEIEVFSLL